MYKQLDFLAVGDITTDAFIHLKEPSAHCDIDHGNMELCMNFGDKIPYDFVEVIRAVGNSPNAAVSAARLGLKSGLVANLGDDQNGKECVDVLKNEKVSTDFVKQHEGKETNYHYVLWFESDRTILVKHHEYDYKFPDVGEPKWIYLSSIGGGTEKYHDEIADYLEKHPSVKLCFQPGTFQIKIGAERLSKIYKNAELVAVNKFEAGKILGKENGDKTEISELLKGIAALGPKTVLITDGPKGAYYFDSRSGETLFSPPYPDPKPPYDRTGAGDAYTSTFVSILALGKSPEEALRNAGVNSMSVVQQIGAQRGLLSQKEIEKYLASAPENYRASTL
ncbi:MAG TPA: carbohydrate kinase family protein [Candidatus Paceibacterota bacterium]